MDEETDDLAEWAEGGRVAIRGMVESLDGDLAAFDRDPLTFEPVLDDFVMRLPLDELEEDDWVWLHTQLAAYLAEVLITNRAGRWARAGERYVVAVEGRDGTVRHVDPFQLVHEELRPVPQRLVRMLERALGEAGA